MKLFLVSAISAGLFSAMYFGFIGHYFSCSAISGATMFSILMYIDDRCDRSAIMSRINNSKGGNNES